MKKTLYYSLFLLLSAGRFLGQTATESAKQFKYEWGANFYEMSMGERIYFENDYGIQNNFFQGIYFKMVKENNLLRASFNYFEKSVGPGQIAQGYKYGIRKAAEWKTGYQFLFLKHNVSPYLFTDLRMQFAKQTGVNFCYTCNYLYDAFVYFPQSPYSYSEATAAPQLGGGIRYTVKNRLIFNLETNAEYYFSFRQYKDVPANQIFRGFSFYPLKFSAGFIL